MGRLGKEKGRGKGVGLNLCTNELRNNDII